MVKVLGHGMESAPAAGGACSRHLQAIHVCQQAGSGAWGWLQLLACKWAAPLVTSPEVVRRTLPLRVTGELPPAAGRAILARLRPLHQTVWHAALHNITVREDLSALGIDRK